MAEQASPLDKLIKDVDVFDVIDIHHLFGKKLNVPSCKPEGTAKTGNVSGQVHSKHVLVQPFFHIQK